MGPFPILAHNSKEVVFSFLRLYKQVEQLVDQAYISKPLHRLSDLDICAVTTPFQQLSEVFQQDSKPDKGITVLPPHIQSFVSVFAKEDFDILSDHH